jgi:HD-GYP domain-containing protein (c-di-GMP phosphodiesterase class II)
MSRPRLGVPAASRSLTLLRLFLVASAAILAAGAFILTNLLTTTLRNQAIDSEVNAAGVYASAVLAPVVVRGNRLVAATPAARAIARSSRVPANVRSLNAWTPDGTLVFTNVAQGRIGHRLPLDDGLRRFFDTGHAFGNTIDLTTDADERATANGRPGHPRLIDTYAPIVGASGRTIGAFEVYVESDHLDAVVARGAREIWLTVGTVFAGLFLALALMVSGASRRMRNQTDALRAGADALQESYALLEQSSLETIETLNATVEAKDPYTSGHSHRVRATALLIGRQLGLGPQRLELLGMAALFHDVGKIGVPDAILTKPMRLTREEFEVVKQHAARGADIVSHISALRGAVPAIRHHHERWDGHGYPAGLAGEAIPLEASIIGMADAWDAMTTDRPYANAIPVAAAVAQLREGRGTQFSPAVVDAFLAVADTTQLAPETGGEPMPRAEATG